MPLKDEQKEKLKKIEQNAGFYTNVILRIFHSVFIFGIVMVLFAGALGLGIGVGYFASLVEHTDVLSKEDYDKAFGNVAETSHLTYADGTKIATISSDLIRTTVSSDQISVLLKKALISTEDENFYEHHGFVPKAVVRALLSEATGIGSSGGSTITQQLIKQQVLTDETTFSRKANEILLASQAEKFYTKDELVTTYLNISPFGRNNKGENIAGVQEAAKGIFGVNATDVNLAQAAYIAGLPQSPIVYSPYTGTGELKEDYSDGLERKDTVLFNMYREKVITKEEYEEAKAYDLSQDFLQQETAEDDDRSFLYYAVLDEATEVLAKQVAKENGLNEAQLADETTYQSYLTKARRQLESEGYTVTSTIDKGLYNAMQYAASSYGSYLDDGSGTPIETGGVMMENSTGKILAFIGSRDYSTNQNNHALDTQRQPGSTIKPILVYGPAIDQGMIGSESMVSDFATKYKSKDQWIENADGKSGSGTFQTVRKALQVSSNVTAYNVYQELLTEKGSSSFVYDNYLAKMNFPDWADWTYESAPLGTPLVTTLDMANGFQTLANGGVYQEGYMIESIKDSKGNVIYQHEADPVQVYSPAAASIMNDLMKSVIDAGVTTSFKSYAASLNADLGQISWAGKTGTSEHNQDSWLIVSTPTVTISNWSGKDDNKPMYSNTGERSGLFLANVVNQLYQSNSGIFGLGQEFHMSPDVKAVQVSSSTGLQRSSFNYEGSTYSDPGKEITSLWVTEDVPKTKYMFGIGGSTANYDSFWRRSYSSGSSSSSSRSSGSSSSTQGGNQNSNQGNAPDNDSDEAEPDDGDDGGAEPDDGGEAPEETPEE